jgi:hypothetical protein
MLLNSSFGMLSSLLGSEIQGNYMSLLSEFSIEQLTNMNIQKYLPFYPVLNKIILNDQYTGFLLLKNEKLVAAINFNTYTKKLQFFEVFQNSLDPLLENKLRLFVSQHFMTK